MNTLTWLFAGAILGWLASIAMRRRSSAKVLNIVVGMVGAFVAGYLLPAVFHVSATDRGIISLPALMIAMGGAVFLLVVVNFFRRENNFKTKVIEHRWAQVRGKILTRWGSLTEEDVNKIDGNYNRLVATVQARYGCAKKDAEDQIQRYLKSVLIKSGLSFGYDRVQQVKENPKPADPKIL